MSTAWVIETAESAHYKPSYFHRSTKGRCLFIWTDDFHLSMKFRSEFDAQGWAKNNHLYCGFRVREYSI